MLQGLHQILHKPRAAEVTPRNSQAIPVQTADILLAYDRRQQHLKDIRAVLNLPAKVYDGLYYQAIKRFAEFVQNLPETQRGLFAHNGGFLDHGIERAARALSLCLTYFFPQEKTLQKMSSQEALWIYAVFTAALFLDVGKLAVKYQVNLCKKDGIVIKEWLPHSGSMIGQSAYYQYDFVKENRDSLQRLVTSLIARRLLTEPDTKARRDLIVNAGGFNWIASNPTVLEAWLSMLSSEGRPMGSFMTVIPLAELEVVGEEIDKLKKPGAYQSPGIFNNPDEGALSTVAGKAFHEWLNQQLMEGGDVEALVKAGLQIAPEGLLITSEVFELFRNSSLNEYRNMPINETRRQFIERLKQFGSPMSELVTNYSHVAGIVAVLQNRYLPAINPGLLKALGQAVLAGEQQQKSPSQSKQPLQQQSQPQLQQQSQPSRVLPVVPPKEASHQRFTL